MWRPDQVCVATGSCPGISSCNWEYFDTSQQQSSGISPFPPCRWLSFHVYAPYPPLPPINQPHNDLTFRQITRTRTINEQWLVSRHNSSTVILTTHIISLIRQNNFLPKCIDTNDTVKEEVTAIEPQYIYIVQPKRKTNACHRSRSIDGSTSTWAAGITVTTLLQFTSNAFLDKRERTCWTRRGGNWCYPPCHQRGHHQVQYINWQLNHTRRMVKTDVEGVG